jgi:molybdopterin-guanine dinucleotide biosynthesis protein A
MGQEKGLVEFRGKPLIQYGMELLSHYTPRILLSAVNPAYQCFGLEVFQDQINECGPAAGIAVTLRNSNTDWNIVLACDLPFLEQELIDALLEKTNHCLAVIPVHNGVKEPLAGLYHRELAIHFEAALNSGILALHQILGTTNVHYLETDHLLEKYPNLFVNFNTLKELNMFL